MSKDFLDEGHFNSHSIFYRKLKLAAASVTLDHISSVIMSFLRHTVFNFILIVLITIGNLSSMEIAAQIVWRLQNNSWYFITNRDTHFYRGMFEPHPYLVVVPKPAVKMTREIEQGNNITISHNTLGFRGREVTSNKLEDILRIAVLGGSTIYCVSTSDDQTWPYLLEKELGPGYEVINLGVPGYSTVENIIQTALILPALNPDVAIFYVGWNDVRNAHIADLKPDYANFHGKTQYYNLRLDLLKVGEGSLLLYHGQNLL